MVYLNEVTDAYHIIMQSSAVRGAVVDETQWRGGKATARDDAAGKSNATAREHNTIF